jgi:hypothetical protein
VIDSVHYKNAAECDEGYEERVFEQGLVSRLGSLRLLTSSLVLHIVLSAGVWRPWENAGMRPGRIALVIVLTISLFACSRSDQTRAADQIRREALLAHMRFLASDLLEGRFPGTRGYDIAALYVASQFEAAGLQPGAPGHSFFQRVPLMKLDSVSGSFTLSRNGQEEQLVLDRDFVLTPYASGDKITVRAPAIFGGYCVSAPELNYNDYAHTDVRGSIVVCLDGAPSRFPSAQRAHYAGWAKIQEAAERGAVGFVDLFVGPMADSYPFPQVVEDSKRSDLRWVEASGQPHDVFPELRANVLASEAGTRKLLAGATRSLEQLTADAEAGTTKSFGLGDFDIRTSATRTLTASANVVATLAGSDPRLRDEYVVYTAHIDHLGIGVPHNGDGIYNGAHDNASGVAALIEIARAFKDLRKAPRRSVLFVGTTGEDSGSLGLLGSDYFATNPTVPRERIAANLNIDGEPTLFDIRDVVAYGAEHSSLAAPVREAAKSIGLELSPDPWPDQGFFVRGDSYSFVRQGIPSVWISGGLKAVDPRIDGRKKALDWFAHLYHTPQDDMNQPFEMKAAVKAARVQFLAGDLIANADARPVWNRGDFFGRTFARTK